MQAIPFSDVGLPRLNESVGDIVQWFKRYEAFCTMKTFGKDLKDDVDIRLTLLPVYLEDTVFLAFDELDLQTKVSYDSAKEALIARFGPKPRKAYELFVQSELSYGTSVETFVDSLKKWLQCAVPGLPADCMEQIVLNQFLLAIPRDKAEQLVLTCERAIGHRLRLKTVVEKAADLSMFVPPVSAAMNHQSTTQQQVGKNKAGKHREGKKEEEKRFRCYNCNVWGHLAAECTKPPKRSKNGTAGTTQR